ncbi:substrate-binding domain-containing protein [Zhihengliuella halotolerans]|uniref:substrate-binding domain-containing protein n=1 Tax=Zhihengliuella halotolerans TaxID=370736 RepID=UPI002155939D|nr:substrate-binding domain-containing protein [Zhihengliuella halotolerans]
MNQNRTWRRPLAAALLVPLLALAACSSSGGRAVPEGENADTAGQTATTETMKIGFVTHAVPGDTFWDIVRAGAEEAAAKDNVELFYASDPEGGRQARLVQQYIDQDVDGIAVTMAKPEAMKDVIAAAEAAGIPVVSLNAGEEKALEYGAFTHFGQDEAVAGEAAGTALKEAGVAHPICVIQEQGHVGLEARCAGIKSVLPDTENLYVQGTDMTQVAATATAELQSNSDADAIVGLGGPFTMTLLDAAKDTGADVQVASFDLNEELASAIADGEVLFTIDQQPWLQGYMAVDSLWQNHRGGFELGGGVATLTGPSVIDSSNVEAVQQFAAEGVR